MITALFYLILGIMVFNFSFSIIFERLNYNNKPDVLPDLISDVYDIENYRKQQHYEKEKTHLSIIESFISSILIIIFFALSGFGLLQELVSGISQNQILQTLIFFGTLGVVSLILSLPFSYYDKFVVEEKYGFNKSTRKLFILDTLKGLILSAVLGGIILGIITWLYLLNPNIFWITALVIMLTFSLIMNALYSTIILPLFNRKTPLPEGTLKNKVVQFANSLGFSINNIYVIDGSKRSTKANAFFTGFGKKKRIFLYDTLTSNLSDDEIVAVLAHELGHYKKHHIWINLTTGLIQTALFLFFFGLISQSVILTKVMGGTGDTSVFYLNALCFVLLVDPIQTLLGLIMNVLSRKMEYSADKFAAIHGVGLNLMNALKKISSLNYSNLTPHPLYVLINYSHPTLYKRLLSIKSWIDTNGGSTSIK
ncbi:MAG: M48 family peptidase [Bacteroidales bacterium]|nr:MAG: M48 family peptidase [Bacteroidales bacterium]